MKKAVEKPKAKIVAKAPAKKASAVSKYSYQRPEKMKPIKRQISQSLKTVRKRKLK